MIEKVSGMKTFWVHTITQEYGSKSRLQAYALKNAFIGIEYTLTLGSIMDRDAIACFAPIWF
jgi:phosphoribosyl-dephospho-CoA transferase